MCEQKWRKCFDKNFFREFFVKKIKKFCLKNSLKATENFLLKNEMFCEKTSLKAVTIRVTDGLQFPSCLSNIRIGLGKYLLSLFPRSRFSFANPSSILSTAQSIAVFLLAVIHSHAWNRASEGDASGARHRFSCVYITVNKLRSLT